ncbi:hypothetical protein DN402_16445 [Streptomyces sp. SW4]|nr:hypothetical protein DN402_16445 [Streptomyces sp. SW4]
MTHEWCVRPASRCGRPGDGAVAAGRDIGTAVTGPNGVGTQHFGDVTVLLPPAFGAVPRPRPSTRRTG